MATEPQERFAVLILTHGRPHKVVTYDTLRKQGYTGDVYIVIDNEDAQGDEYRRVFGERVIVFDKEAVARRFDEGDNFRDRRAVFYARNAAFQIARDLGLDYFLQLDDDYSDFRFKFRGDLTYTHRLLVKNLDRLFAVMLTYLKRIPALTITFAQGGDFQGGAASGDATRLWLKRKAMNTFFCATDRPFAFVGRINEDVNTYVSLGQRGGLFLMCFNAAIQQEQTQHAAGGMSELYLNVGTYTKSFYSVMYAPSCVKVHQMGNTYPRIHHKITWSNAVPCILSERHRRAD